MAPKFLSACMLAFACATGPANAQDASVPVPSGSCALVDTKARLEACLIAAMADSNAVRDDIKTRSEKIYARDENSYDKIADSLLGALTEDSCFAAAFSHANVQIAFLVIDEKAVSTPALQKEVKLLLINSSVCNAGLAKAVAPYNELGDAALRLKALSDRQKALAASM